MKLVPLTRGQFAIVDDADFDTLIEFKWYAQWNESTKSFYAARASYRRQVRMHRVIMGLGHGRRRPVDHINRNTLDNRRENLRICTPTQNCANSVRSKRNSTGYKGVTFNKQQGRYVARVRINCKSKFLGYFSDPKLAHEAYVKAATKLFGKFANAG